ALVSLSFLWICWLNDDSNETFSIAHRTLVFTIELNLRRLRRSRRGLGFRARPDQCVELRVRFRLPRCIIRGIIAVRRLVHVMKSYRVNPSSSRSLEA